MENISDDLKSPSPLSPDSDSARGTISDLTPEDDGLPSLTKLVPPDSEFSDLDVSKDDIESNADSASMSKNSRSKTSESIQLPTDVREDCLSGDQNASHTLHLSPFPVEGYLQSSSDSQNGSMDAAPSDTDKESFSTSLNDTIYENDSTIDSYDTPIEEYPMEKEIDTSTNLHLGEMPDTNNDVFSDEKTLVSKEAYVYSYSSDSDESEQSSDKPKLQFKSEAYLKPVESVNPLDQHEEMKADIIMPQEIKAPVQDECCLPDQEEKIKISTYVACGPETLIQNEPCPPELKEEMRTDMILPKEMKTYIPEDSCAVDESDEIRTDTIVANEIAMHITDKPCQHLDKEDECLPLDATLHISKAGIVQEYINSSKVLNLSQGNINAKQLEDISIPKEDEVVTIVINKGNAYSSDDSCLLPLSSSNREIDEPLEFESASVSSVSKKNSSHVTATVGENTSITDSEEGDAADSSENEMVVSASMQFTLTPPCDKSNGAIPEREEKLPVTSGSAGVPVQVKQFKEHVSLSFSEEPSSFEETLATEDEIDDSALDESSPLREKLSQVQSQPEPQMVLPETVTRLVTQDGSDVYLVGTVHFSKESQDDVAKTIKLVRPDVVMVELCKSRRAVLELDEETILTESQSLNFNKMCLIMKQHGKVKGILYLLLLSVSAHITRQLGMAPGGEFRIAFAEAQRSAPGCRILLGDRPIQITLSRALASLSVWQKMKLMWHIFTCKEPISKEEIEKCKQRDLIEEMLAEMTGHFPAITEVFVKERDIYLTRSLQLAAQPLPDPRSPTGLAPIVAVGVVGIGHVPGIQNHWGKITEEDIPPIMKIPPPSLADKVCKFTLKFTIYGVIGFGIYKCIPNATKSSILSTLENGVNEVSKYFTK